MSNDENVNRNVDKDVGKWINYVQFSGSHLKAPRFFSRSVSLVSLSLLSTICLCILLSTQYCDLKDHLTILYIERVQL